MKLLRHIGSSPFVAMTALSALIHSAWTLSILFGGTEPPLSLAWAGWVLPGFLIAASIDVGLLYTSLQIRSGDRALTRYAVFVTLAFSMFALQLFYIISHMPVVALAPGVRAEWQPALTLFRDSMILLAPALLPIAITLHSIGDFQKKPTTAEASTALALVSQADPELVIEEPAPKTYEIECHEPGCVWSGVYVDARAARFALQAHQRTHKVKVNQ